MEKMTLPFEVAKPPKSHRRASLATPDVNQMYPRVAFSAQRNQVVFLITTRVAAKFEVMYLQILHAAAKLASPAVAFQHLPMQLAIAVGIESHSPVLQRASFTKPAG